MRQAPKYIDWFVTLSKTSNIKKVQDITMAIILRRNINTNLIM